tara:strand:+ start:1483 stop:1776 length:294 start_codon:yes stop_codon:yes gene_type:complete
MNKNEYHNYKQSVDNFFKKEGINNLSQITDDDGYCEPYFSSIYCECCNRPLGGDRFDCNGYNSEHNKIYEYSVCTDCIYYAEYGYLDDVTMDEILQD